MCDRLVCLFVFVFVCLFVLFCFFVVFKSFNHRDNHILSSLMFHAGCVFVAGIHPSRTSMSGSFQSVRWNACVHRLDLGLCSHPKELLGNRVRTHVNSKGKILICWRLRAGSNPRRCITQGQRAQHTISCAITALDRWINKSNLKAALGIILLYKLQSTFTELIFSGVPHKQFFFFLRRNVNAPECQSLKQHSMIGFWCQ